MSRYDDIFYIDQTDWTSSDFRYLDSVANRIFSYCETKKEYHDYVLNLDISRMTIQTKAIIKCNVMHYHNLDEMIVKYPNLKELKEVGPLEDPLYLNEKPLNIFAEYRDMNILL